MPVSSAAHLVLVSKYYNFVNQSLLIDICLHLGSLLAIIFYFRNDLFNFIKNKNFLINDFFYKDKKIKIKLNTKYIHSKDLLENLCLAIKIALDLKIDKKIRIIDE